jgi:hypothetical protein
VELAETVEFRDGSDDGDVDDLRSTGCTFEGGTICCICAGSGYAEDKVAAASGMGGYIEALGSSILLKWWWC